MTTQNKFIITRKLYTKYGQLANHHYNKPGGGCCDPLYKQCCRIKGFLAGVLYKNGWTSWI